MSNQKLVSPITKQEIPRNLSSLGIEKGWSGQSLDKIRMMLLAHGGHGKTTFVMSNPKAVVFDFEGQAQECLVQKAARVHKATWSEYEKVIDALISMGSSCPYSTVVLDTADSMIERILIPHLTEVYSSEVNEGEVITDLSHGKGYRRLRDFIQHQIVGKLERAGFQVVITAHIMEVYYEDRGEGQKRRTKPCLSPSILAAFQDQAAFVTLLGRETTKHYNPKTKKRTEEHTWALYQSFPSDESPYGPKSRYLQYLPTKIVLSHDNGWDDASAAYEKALEEAKKEIGE